LEALCVVELLDSADQAEVSLLNEVEKLHAATGVPLCQRDDESEVCAQEVTLRTLTVTRDPLEFTTELLPLFSIRHLSEFVFGEQASLDAHRQLDLFGGVEQRNLADLLQVVLDGICRRTRDRGRVDRHLVFII